MINNVDKHFPVFVANRMAKIEQASTPAQLRFIDSLPNVADHVSRGLTASELTANNSCFEHPSFIKHSKESWPRCPCAFPDFLEEFLVLRSHKITMKVNGSESLSLGFSRYTLLGTNYKLLQLGYCASKGYYVTKTVRLWRFNHR